MLDKQIDILIVEDNPGDRLILSTYLKKTGLHIGELFIAEDLESAFAILSEQKPDIVFLDLFLPDSIGLDSFRRVANVNAFIPIVILTGLSDARLALEAIASGAQDYLIKGDFNEKILNKTIQYSIERKLAHLQLALSEKRFRALSENSYDGLTVLNKDLGIIEISPAGRKILGYSPDEVIAQFSIEVIHPEDQQLVNKSLNEILEDATIVRLIEYRFEMPDGSYKWLESSFHNLLHEPAVNAIVLNYREITERKKSESLLKESEERYRFLFEKNPMSIMIWDIATLQILEVNETMNFEYGYSKEELPGMGIMDICAAEEQKAFKQFADKFYTSADNLFTGIWQHRKKDGELMTMEIFFHKIYYRGRQCVLAMVKNITEKLFLEARLEEEKSNQQKQITEAIIKAQERERAEIGKELHDNVNQILSITNLYLHCAITGVGSKENFIADSKKNVMDAMKEIQKISRAITPPDISYLGLEPVIKSLTANLKSTNMYEIDLVLDFGEEEEINNNIKLTIYRIIQEQINNIIKHAEAKKINITLIKSDDNILELDIVDDGKGFEMGKTNYGIGITNIKNRVELYNGQMELISSPNAGCSLHVTFPL
ncbi:PAS domain S-box protein [Limnovirga soli]|uniref:histidine kinase n=1 Tax=Limnovirga soli TaxID=2656915 RepID=A0A8J8FE08_9BACT|nr:PAS domain S-box protein [Limnovirga soli]NNV54968.1 PAS domain S-box protein [Limnovirga soli]